MNKIGVKSINRLILRCVLEIVFVVTLLIVSYGSFTTSNLSAAMSTAEESVKTKRDVQLSFNRTNENILSVMNNENVLDEGVLSLKNPNKMDVAVTIVLCVKYDSNINVGTYKIGIGDEILELKDAKIEDGYFKLDISKRAIKKYNSQDMTVTIYGNPYAGTKLEYTFMAL